jgi:hypothetical protein
MNRITKSFLVTTAVFITIFTGSLLYLELFMPADRSAADRSNLEIRFSSMSKEEVIKHASLIMNLDDDLSYDLRKAYSATLIVGLCYSIYALICISKNIVK